MYEIQKTKFKTSGGVFSIAHDFNETVAMDLEQFGGVYILHMLDHATRYSAAAIISSK